MNDVYPVFAKRWYGFGDSDWYWQLFSIHEEEKTAKETVDRMTENYLQDMPRRRIHRSANPYSKDRPVEFMYQGNMVI